MADVLSFRLRQRPVRIAAAISTLAVSFFYLLAQMAGAGGLVALLLGIDSVVGQRAVVGIVGVIMIFYVIYGGMKGTTWVQIIKAVLLIAGAGLMFIWVLSMFGFNLSSLHRCRQRDDRERPRHPARPDAAGPAVQEPDRLHLVVDGPGSRHRRPAARAHALLHGAHLARGAPLGGLGDLAHRPVLPVHARPRLRRAQMLGPSEIKNAPGGANSAAPLLAFELGGEVFLGIISGVAFATILAVVAGLTITASASLSHDVYNTIVKDGNATRRRR